MRADEGIEDVMFWYSSSEVMFCSCVLSVIVTVMRVEWGPGNNDRKIFVSTTIRDRYEVLFVRS